MQKSQKNQKNQIDIAALGGSFDPPTLGHVKTAQFVLENIPTLKSVILVPCYEHMYGKQMAPFEHRLEMCSLALEKVYPAIKCSSFERTYKITNTYNLISQIKRNMSTHKEKRNLRFIIGLDNANTFDEWKDCEKLKEMVSFIVVPRQGITRDPNVDWYTKTPHIYLETDNPIPETSSTSAREALKVGDEKALSKLLDPKVLEYIRQHNLYS